jgi:hypothetical protein
MVLLHEAEEAGLWSGPDDSQDADLHDAVPELPDDVVSQLFDRVTAQVKVPRAHVDAYLARDPDRGRQPEARRIRYAIAGSELQAHAWIGALRSGSTIDDEEARHGEMWLHRGELIGTLEDAAFGADPGDIVGPLELELGWAVALLVAVRPASRRPEAELRAMVEQELLRDARARAFDAWIDARRTALTRIEDEFQHPGHPVHGLPQHRH